MNFASQRDSSPPYSFFHNYFSTLQSRGRERLTDTLHKSSVVYTLLFLILVISFVLVRGSPSLYSFYQSVLQIFGVRAQPSTTALRSPRRRRPRPKAAGDKKMRKVVVIDQHGARLDTIAVDAKPMRGQVVKKLVNAEEATRMLRSGASSVDGMNGSGLVNMQQCLLASNDPMEDTCAHAFYNVPGREDGYWSFFGVYDGHYGPDTSSYLERSLIPTVFTSLKRLYESKPTVPTEEEIARRFQSAFVSIDNRLMNSPTQAGTHGSCAILALHDSTTQTLRLALTGDSRAVLGRSVGSSNIRWLAKPLTVDQAILSNPSEEKRIKSEHPGENIITNNRILGDLAVSRAFGDARFKSPSLLPSQFKTPPYLTAEPVVTSVKIEPTRGDFVIIGSDGLWDFLTNEDAVAIVGRWLDDHKTEGSTTRTRRSTKLTSDQEENFVFVDDNAGTHLIRNALGGAKEGRVRFSLTVPPGRDLAKRYRDDLTAMVVFFE